MVKRNRVFDNFFNQVRDNHYWSQNDPVVVAVSTGVDSMVLLDLLTKLPPTLKPKIIVAHINHKLRKQSEKERIFLQKYCQQNGLIFELSIWAKNMHPATGIEAAGRQFRYAFFKKVMHKYNARILMTAHHANDQAETVLMKLIRGNYISGLSGIELKRSFDTGELIRPLLKFKKNDIKQYAIKNEVKWFEDVTNKDLDVQRNRFRNVILPLMQKENLHAVEHIGEFSEELNDLKKTNEFLLKQTLKYVWNSKNDSLNIKSLSKYPDYIQRSLIVYLIFHKKNIKNVKPKLIDEILTLLKNSHKPQAKFRLTKDVYLTKNYNLCTINDDNNETLVNDAKTTSLLINHWYKSIAGFSFGVFDEQFNYGALNEIDRKSTFYLNDKQLPLIVRLTNKNDKITLKNGGHQSAKRIFINKKVPNFFRERAQTLLDKDGRVLSIIGYSESTILKSTDKRYTLLVKGINLKGEEHE
ncbi:tRNA lysidine(34) synthetase TilS [Apilactobacillus sp. M161]|uniref:tRNA(Ile)-lysidine synthase n=1 Tax=Apilactobacillus xinyiensis TaxID=2841032 RepID=A0ABT0I323_9LACO|nr:tRNA lysidine(34) synthetase TilS [Apilactobacillus xinyiensis]MCK8625145.1 tRNA lysidine(34) synthetase TilS [Apilactobacillus xinyiensis]